MNIINFKNWDQEFFDEDYDRVTENRISKMITISQNRADRMPFLFKAAKKWVILKFLKDPNFEIKTYFKSALQGAYGHIKLAESNGASLSLWIGDKKVDLTHEEGLKGDVSNLYEYLKFAYVTRCKELENIIFDIFEKNEKSFFSNDNMIGHFTYPIYFLERSHSWLNSDKIKELLSDIDLYAANEYKNDKEFGGWYSECLVPLNKLREALFFGNEENFNIQLKITLDKNRAYFDNKEDNRFRDMKNWLPWDIIAYACRAYDKGWKITVEDSRLPMFLVEGKCNVTTLAPE